MLYSTGGMVDIKKNSEKKREIWIDISRVLGMFAIAYGHSRQAMEPGPDSWTGLIGAPIFDAGFPCCLVLMFFFLSAWLQRGSDKLLEWRQYLLYIIPTVIWNIIHMMIPGNAPETFWQGICLLGLVPYLGSSNSALWFMPELAFYSLILPLIRRVPIPLLAAGAILCLYFSQKFQYGAYWVTTKNLETVFFILTGAALSQCDRAAVVKFFKTSAWLIAPVAWMIQLGIPLISTFIYPIPQGPSLNPCAAYCVLGVWACLSYGVVLEALFSRISRWIAFLSPMVFFVYASHNVFYETIYYASNKYHLPLLPGNYFILYTVGVFAVCFAVWCGVRRLNCRPLSRYVFLLR